MPAGAQATILSVDDELNSLILRKMLLERAGYRVISASSGREALRLFDFETPDLLLTDQVMQGMTGTALARAVRDRNPKVPIIIISGLNDLPPDAGIANVFMSKLEGAAKLLHNIATVLQRGSSAGDGDQISNGDSKETT
jgi:CheY-like chemotaxis protein